VAGASSSTPGASPDATPETTSDVISDATTTLAAGETPGAGDTDRPTQKFARLAVRMDVRVSTIDPETDPWTGKTFFRSSEETCANVSRGGAFVVTKETIPRGRRLLVELVLPDGREVQTMARVAWSSSIAQGAPAGQREERGIGVEFLGGSRNQLLELERFIARSFRRRQRTADTGYPLSTGG
jgi:hypothetical protein